MQFDKKETLSDKEWYCICFMNAARTTEWILYPEGTGREYLVDSEGICYRVLKRRWCPFKTNTWITTLPNRMSLPGRSCHRIGNDSTARCVGLRQAFYQMAYFNIC